MENEYWLKGSVRNFGCEGIRKFAVAMGMRHCTLCDIHYIRALPANKPETTYMVIIIHKMVAGFA